ncbi:DNA topoisomerase 2 [Lathyrus oleraceus]|uniref:DNA topoisomerase (ATP-hydrolyzing) n=1 Tax=Pisum sativum TaxID=3888 RepID=A0A9D4Y306_PEA|nr:DNA topoisomerase 2 [Pisum sativum]
MDSLKVRIDPEANAVSVYNNGDGVLVEIHQEEKVYVPELIFGHLLTSSNHDDNVKKTTGGRNGYGAELTNIFSTEFIIEIVDGRRLKKYKQVFSNNMGTKCEPVITKCKASENWTKECEKLGIALPGLALAQQLYVSLKARGEGDLGTQALILVLERLNNVSLPPLV